MKIVNVILSGGTGSRLWPLSRASLPKQFLPILQDNSTLFASTIVRNMNICDEFLIATNKSQYYLACDEIEKIYREGGAKSFKFLLESEGKNTAPIIAMASMLYLKDDILIVTPSDHLILNQTAYQDSLKKAVEIARLGSIVLLGHKPNTPSVEYGYIGVSDDLQSVECFIEKPDINQAIQLIQSGNFFHNCGILVFRVGDFLKELQNICPDIFSASQEELKHLQKDGNVYHISDMSKFENISIDYALLQKCCGLKCIRVDMGWSDLGSFTSMQNILKNQNKSRIIEQDSSDNIIYCNKQKTIALLGVKDVVLIDSDDALLLCPKKDLHKMRELSSNLKNDDIMQTSSKGIRPWGYFEVLEVGLGYKIKKIVVLPNRRLSLQKHQHRSEHWVVLSGTASVSIEDKETMVCPNESVYIKMGQKHRLCNKGKIPLVIIEIQVGEYTGEDDIERFSDDYRR